MTDVPRRHSVAELGGRDGQPLIFAHGFGCDQEIRGSTLVVLRATGHCPNVSAPEETIAAIRAFL